MGTSPEAPWHPRFQSIEVKVVRALGRGAFGEVVLVKALPRQGTDGADAHAAGAFALKRTSLSQISEAGLEKAQKEAKLLQRLGEDHESILQCFDFRIVPGPNAALELLLEFAPLGDLSGRIKAHKGSKAGNCGGLPEAEAVSYGCDVAAALAHIHSLSPKVLHRDVKPANVVLFPTMDDSRWDQGTPRAKLADFGIAKVLEADGSLVGAKTIIGTPHYFSPEICRGETYDERSDAWALGCVIYEMLCLHRPFHQAEGNIAVLALRVMEGRYDREALMRQAGCYNGSLIFALTGLLTPDPQQRQRASEVLQPLGKLRSELTGKEVPVTLPWWEVDPSLFASGGCNNAPAAEATASAVPNPSGTDSWQGAEEVTIGVTIGADGATLNPLREVVTALHPTAIPSPKWKRTSELLLDAAVEVSPTDLWNLPTLNPNLAATSRAGLDGTQKLSEEELTRLHSTDSERTAQVGVETPDLLGETARLGETVKPGSPAFNPDNDLGCTVELGETGIFKENGNDAKMQNMAPSRMAWMGMTNMMDIMSEPPPVDGLGKTLQSKPPVTSPGSCTVHPEDAHPDAGCPQAAGSGAAAPPQHQDFLPGEGADQTFWAEPRIFLRPLWRPTDAEPAPVDAPVIFCFTRDHLGQPPQQQERGQTQASQAPPSTPQSYQPLDGHGQHEYVGAHSSENGCVPTGCTYGLDSAHGWMEVELTVEKSAALNAHMPRTASQQQTHEFGDIFELTAVS